MWMCVFSCVSVCVCVCVCVYVCVCCRMGDDGSDHAAFVQHLGMAGANMGFSAGSKYPTYQ
jgi:hypothetical protein